MIPESEIREFPEHAVKSKIESIFVNEKTLENILLGFIKLILIFVGITKKKYKLTKMGVNTYYLELIIILLNIFSPQKLMKKNHVERDLIVEEKRQEVLEKKFGCKLIRINTSKEGYDADYEVSRIQTFITEFRDRQLKNLSKKIKELEDKIQELKLQLTSRSVYNALSKNTTQIIKMVGKIYYQ